jgi:ABC-type Fe3+ transport system permease subunit
MVTAFSLLEQVDRLCGVFATALHNSELQIYATLGILLVLGVFLFPPKNDSDQI